MSTAFSIDKNKLRQSFACAANTYDGLAYLQREVGFDLLSLFQLNNEEKQRVVDLGCGTGFLTQQITQKNNFKELLAIDIALPMLQATQIRLKHSSNIQYLCADAECLPLLESTVNHIYSNLALQWCQNLTAVFTGFSKIMKKGGQLNFSTFGPATLQELKKSWAEVDHHQHVNEFYSDSDLRHFLQQTGFNHIQIEARQYQSNYPSVIGLMRELKGIGAHNVLTGRNRKTTSKSQMQKMFAVYEQYRENNMIPASYEVIFVSASISK